MKGMTRERFNFLMNNIDAVLTKEEMHNGWHFCPEFDGLLMRVGDDSVGILKSCYCGAQEYWKYTVKFTNIKDES